MSRLWLMAALLAVLLDLDPMLARKEVVYTVVVAAGAVEAVEVVTEQVVIVVLVLQQDRGSPLDPYAWISLLAKELD